MDVERTVRQIARKQVGHALDVGHLGGGDGLVFAGVEVTDAGKDDAALGEGLQAGFFQQVLIAPADDLRQGHADDEAAGARLPGVEVAVGVEPEEGGDDARFLQAGEHANGGHTIAGDADRPPAGAHSARHGVAQWGEQRAEPPVLLRQGEQARYRLVGAAVDDPAAPGQVVHARGAAAHIVGGENKLIVHGIYSSR